MSLWGWAKSIVVDFPGWGGSGDSNSPAAISPTVQRWQNELFLARTLYGGWDSVRQQSRYFLPRHPAEEPEDYAVRLARPTFYNAFARTVRALSGIVFRDDPELDGIPEPIAKLYRDDIDNQGTAAPMFLRHTFADGLVTGLAGILVDMPAAVPGLTALEEIEQGIRPFWRLVRKDDIVSFLVIVENGRQLLGQIVLREEAHQASGAYGVNVVERLRVFRRLPTEAGPVVTFQLFQKNNKGEFTPVGAPGLMRNVTAIPLAPIYTERVGFFDANPPLIDLANLNLLHYQTASDLHHAAHIANVPVLFGIGLDADQVKIGPNHAILIKQAEDNATLRWLETTGASIGSTRAILSDIEEQMANLGLGMLQRKSRAAETAQKASLDRQEQDATLAAIVSDLENGIEQALFYTAQFLGLPKGGRVKFRRDFALEPGNAPRTERQGAANPPNEPNPIQE